MRKILVVIDMQNDFIDGSLGTKEAQQIVPRVVEKMKEYDPWNIYLTRDTHYENYLDTQEGRNLPVEHCIEGTHGWQLNDAVAKAAEKATVIDKPTFGLHRRHSKRNSRLDHCVRLLHHGSRGRAVKAVIAYYRGLVLGRFVVLLYHQVVELGGELPVHKLHYIARTVFANVRKVLALALKQRSGVRAVLAVSLRREFSDIHPSRQEYQRFFT